jgi:hypothetical protein
MGSAHRNAQRLAACWALVLLVASLASAAPPATPVVTLPKPPAPATAPAKQAAPAAAAGTAAVPVPVAANARSPPPSKGVPVCICAFGYTSTACTKAVAGTCTGAIPADTLPFCKAMTDLSKLRTDAGAAAAAGSFLSSSCLTPAGLTAGDVCSCIEVRGEGGEGGAHISMDQGA